MKKFEILHGVVVPLDRPHVDTDAIIPKQYLKSVQRSGFGPNLFDDWRYTEPGEPGQDHSQRELQSDFVLNLPRYAEAEILLGREKLRLRLIARTRRVGIGRCRFQGDHRAKLC